MLSSLVSVACVTCHLLLPLLLSIRRQQLDQRHQLPLNQKPLSPVKIQLTGLSGAALTLSLPYVLQGLDPFAECGLRIAGFFYACKLLDLGVVRAEQPPALTQTNYGDESPRWRRHIEYALRIVTEMRYYSFDMAIHQKHRTTLNRDQAMLRSILPPIAIVTLNLLFPRPETKCMLLLLVIQYALAMLHSLLHPHCAYHLFYYPFTATSLNSFWTTKWHACAAPFLRSLAYEPGKRRLGRAGGAVMVFALSGVWHGWASMPLMEDDQAVRIAFEVTIFFILMGVGGIIEQGVWGRSEGGVVRWVVTWTVALMLGGWCFRTLECGTKVGWLKDPTCP